MTGFAQFTMGHLLASVLFLAAVVGLGFLILLPLKFRYEKKFPERRFPMKKVLFYVTFAGYLGILLYVTFLGREAERFGAINLHLFRAVREAWNHASQQHWLNVILNVGMFVPLGFCLPLLHKNLKHWYVPVAAGLVLSALIEGIQFFTATGVMDVDDLLCNSLGALLGGCLVFALLFFKEKQYRRFFLALCPVILSLFLPAVALCAYSFQEYGNLPSAPTYRSSTGRTRWTVECSVPREPREAMVYRAPSLNQEAADRFAEEFSNSHGLDFVKKERYDGASLYYNAGESAYLYLLYRDGSYLYQAEGFREEASQNFEREQVLEALQPFRLDIPPQARFYPAGEDSLFLTVEKLPGEKGMYDGSVRCRLSPEGTLLELEQYLIFYREYGMASILSPEEALARLERGDFAGPEWAFGKEPEEYRITGWELQYRVDTKGFYRPVYVFKALADNREIPEGLLVPAM